MSERYYFEDKNQLVRYLYSSLSNPTQIKIQKTLYLLYAFYGATYGQLYHEEDKEDFGGQIYPKELFDSNFQAWRYGPVEFDVYKDEKQGAYERVGEVSLNESTPEDKNIKQFIDDLVSQIEQIDDFSLVDRTHQDNVWIEAYKDGGQYIPMSNEAIIEEYKERYIAHEV